MFITINFIIWNEPYTISLPCPKKYPNYVYLGNGDGSHWDQEETHWYFLLLRWWGLNTARSVYLTTRVEKKVWDETQPTRVGFAQGGMSCFETLDVLTVTKWMKAIPVPGDQAIRVWAPHHIARTDPGVGESLLITQSREFRPLQK